MTDREIILLEVARRGRDSAPAPVDYATMRADVAEVKARPNIQKVTDIPDVVGVPADGEALVYNAGNDQWEPGSAGGTLSAVQRSGTIIGTDIDTINFVEGFTANTDDRPGRADVYLNFAGNGTSTSASRHDHWHNNPPPVFVPITPGGYLSGGTRTLASTTVTLSPGITYNVRAEINMQMRGADPGPCYYRLSVAINGNTKTSPSGANGFWCVQGVPDKTTWAHVVRLTGTGGAVSVTASVTYDSGGGFYTDAGDVEISLDPNR